MKIEATFYTPETVRKLEMKIGNAWGSRDYAKVGALGEILNKLYAGNKAAGVTGGIIWDTPGKKDSPDPDIGGGSDTSTPVSE